MDSVSCRSKLKSDTADLPLFSNQVLRSMLYLGVLVSILADDVSSSNLMSSSICLPSGCGISPRGEDRKVDNAYEISYTFYSD
jgi:hypothetical protein